MSISKDKIVAALDTFLPAFNAGWIAATKENGSEATLGFAPYPSREQLRDAAHEFVMADDDLKNYPYKSVVGAVEERVQHIDNHNNGRVQ